MHGLAEMPVDNMPSIDGLRFTRRRESWVAVAGGHFYKIARKGDDPRRDLADPACGATARREYDDLRFLATLGTAVCRPQRLDRGCVVYPLLSGPDMRTLLLAHHPHAQQRACLRSAMRLLARLHRGDTAGYPVKDYRREGFIDPPPEVLGHMRERRRTLVVTGFEARNFRFDTGRDAWCFFDPHHVWSGHPEEDFARFVVSLLMLPGRRAGPRAWTRFDRFRMLADYEAEAPARLDRSLLNFFLAEELAMREFHARNSARRMPAAVRPFGVAYTALYYRRLRRALASQRF